MLLQHGAGFLQPHCFYPDVGYPAHPAPRHGATPPPPPHFDIDAFLSHPASYQVPSPSLSAATPASSSCHQGLQHHSYHHHHHHHNQQQQQQQYHPHHPHHHQYNDNNTNSHHHGAASACYPQHEQSPLGQYYGSAAAACACGCPAFQPVQDTFLHKILTGKGYKHDATRRRNPWSRRLGGRHLAASGHSVDNLSCASSSSSGSLGNLSCGSSSAGSVGNLSCGSGSIDNMSCGSGSIGNLHYGSGGGSIGNLSCGSGSIDNMSCGSGSIGNLSCGSGSIDNIHCGSGSLDNSIHCGTGSLDNLHLGSGSGSIDNLHCGGGSLDNLHCGSSGYGASPGLCADFALAASCCYAASGVAAMPLSAAAFPPAIPGF